MSLLEERPVHRFRDPKYIMSLYVYPVEKCGTDLQRGEPLEESAEGTDLYELKMKANQLIMSAMSSEGYDGECFVEVRVEKDGEYCESDEYWVNVDLVENKVVNEGRYVHNQV